MFETSKDFLNLALGIGGGLALLMLTVVFYYIARILRQMFKAVSTIEGAFSAVQNMFTKIGERLSDVSALGRFATDVIKIVSDAKEVKEEWTDKKSKKK